MSGDHKGTYIYNLTGGSNITMTEIQTHLKSLLASVCANLSKTNILRCRAHGDTACLYND